jgi:hypothetical protein
LCCGLLRSSRFFVAPVLLGRALANIAFLGEMAAVDYAESFFMLRFRHGVSSVYP